MLKGNSPIIISEEPPKYSKTEKLTLYKMAGEGKIPAVKVKFRER